MVTMTRLVWAGSAASRLMKGGAVIFVIARSCVPGGWTMTLKLQLLVFNASSVAVHTTVFVPASKSDPDGGTQATLTPPQRSIAGGVANVTTALFVPGSNAAIISDGQVMTGGVSSNTFTLKVQFVMPATFEAVQVTV